MSKNFKRILAIVLAVLTLSACATLAVFATADETQANNGKVCRIGAEGIGTYYGTLADAV